jgi:hypothetical protein
MKLRSSKNERSGKSLTSLIVREYTISYEEGSDISYLNDDMGNLTEIQIDGWAELFATATRDLLASDSTSTPSPVVEEDVVDVHEVDSVTDIDGVDGDDLVVVKSALRKPKK